MHKDPIRIILEILRSLFGPERRCWIIMSGTAIKHMKSTVFHTTYMCQLWCVLPVCWVCAGVLQRAADVLCVCLHTPDNPHWSDSEGLAEWKLAPPTPSRSQTQLLIHIHLHLHPYTHRKHITSQCLLSAMISPDCSALTEISTLTIDHLDTFSLLLSLWLTFLLNELYSIFCCN